MLRADWNDKERFKDRYQRNNKFGGQKNLRCYPTCSASGHRDSGFCGMALSCVVHDLPRLEVGEEYRAFGEFIICGTKELMRPNSTLPLEEAQAKERSVSQPKLPWLGGDVRLLDNNDFSIAFNRQLGGWHYGWRANKHSCDSYHCFRAYIFKLKNDSTDLVYVGSVSSPVFQVYSRRRQRGVAKSPASSEGAPETTSLSSPPQPPPGTPGVQKRGREAVDKESAPASGQVKTARLSREALDAVARAASSSDAAGGSKSASDGFGPGSGLGATMTLPLRALASAAMDSKTLDTLMESFSSDNMRNRTLDRLTYFVFQWANGTEAAWDDSDRTTNVSHEDLSHGGESGSPSEIGSCDAGFGLEMDLSEALCGPNFVDPQLIHSSTGGVGGSAQHHAGRGADGTDPDLSGPVASFLHGINNGQGGGGGGGGGTDVRTMPLGSRFGPSAHALKDATVKNVGEGMNQLRGILRREASFANDPQRIDMILEGIEAITECVIRLAKNNKAFNSIVAAYSSPEGIKRLKSRIESERNVDFVWSSNREDRTYDPTLVDDPDHESSIYGMLRQQFRNIMSSAIENTGQRLPPFIEPMDLAARFGVVTPDPYYPPAPRAAAFIHMQLYGSLDNFEKEDYGSRKGEFVDEAQRCQYAKDLMVVRRGIMRRIVCDRIVSDQRTRAHFSAREREPPVPQGWDINGTWIMVGQVEDERYRKSSESLGALLSVCSGVNMGGFFNRVFTTMLSKIEIAISADTFTSRGQQMLLADPRLVASLKGKPHCWRPPMPMVVGYAGVHPLSQEKLIVGWLSVENDGCHCINIVVGGPLFAEAVSDLACDTIRRRDGEPNTEAAQRMTAFFQKHVRAGDIPQIRVHKRFLISQSRQHMVMEDNLHIFPRPELTPRMDKTAELKTLPQERDYKYTGVCVRHKFMRCYLNQSDTDMILDLL